MTSDRKKSSAGFWLTVALVAVLVGYPLSFGPACWIRARLGNAPKWEVTDSIFRPVLMAWFHGGTPGKMIKWYANVGSPLPVLVGRHNGEYEANFIWEFRK